MAMIIAILEDNEERTAAMLDCLRDKFRQYEARVFSTSRETIRFLETSLDNTVLISLDHDLELKPDGAGGMVDGGTGREVADFLASRAATCPVLIHTTNSHAAVGMDRVLRESGWATYRVVPFDDMAWIRTDWLKTVRRAILNSARVGMKALPKG
jgi:hypothetical protein